MNKLHLLDDILYKGLQPWLAKNNPDEKYAAMSPVKAVEPVNTMKYKVEFFRPFNNKTSYYQKLILSETNKYCDRVINFIKEDDDFRVIKFKLNDTLDKKLKTRLKEIGKLIKEKNLDLIYIDPSKITFDLDTDHKTDTYIIQLLKVCFMKIYLEIQDVFQEYRPELMIIDDFYTRWLFEPIPTRYFLIKIPPDIILEPVKSKGKKDITVLPKQTFNSFTYIHLSNAPDKITNLCDSLKKLQFIAEDTSLNCFKKVFSGKEIVQPVVWTGNVSEFYYFIHLICKKLRLVVDLKQQHWKVACICFIPEIGQSFDPLKFRRRKKPLLTAANVELAVKHLM